MHYSGISPILKLSLLLLFMVAACATYVDAQSTPPADATTEDVLIENVYLARSGDEGEAGEPVEEFFTTDIPIFCVVELVVTEPVSVTLNFVAVRVPGVRPETRVVTTTYKTKEGENIVNFSGRPHKLWHAGRYRADILIDGKLQTSLEFDIKRR